MCADNCNNDNCKNNGRVFDETIELKDNAMLNHRMDLFYEWDFDKNDKLGLDVYEVTKGMGKRVWWICSKCESSYDAPIAERSSGNNCPYCKGLRVNHTNSLAFKNPEISLEWEYEKNGDLTPHDIPSNTSRKFWWKCSKCFSSFQASVTKRNNKRKCSYCSGRKVNHTNSLASLRPDLASQWHPTLNGGLTPHDVTCSKGLKVWWKCSHGHEWDAVIDNRNKGRNCPICSNRVILVGFNDMWTTNPKLAGMIANPDEGFTNTHSSHKKVDWKCLTCDSVIESKAIYQIKNQGLSCPNCSDNIKYPEKVMHHFLKELGLEFSTQKVFPWLPNRRYDFYLLEYNLIIETHGQQHYTKSFESVGGRSLAEEQENDKLKYETALLNDINKYIEIDARLSDFEHIKNSILKSDLVNIFNIDGIRWDKINFDSQKSFNIEILQLWNYGKSVKEISDIVKLHKNTIAKVLKNFHNLGKCLYNPNKLKRRT